MNIMKNVKGDFGMFIGAGFGVFVFFVVVGYFVFSWGGFFGDGGVGSSIGDSGCVVSERFYEIERGRVEYKISGFTDGVSVLYFKDYGNIERYEWDTVSATRDGRETRSHMAFLDYYDGNFSTLLDLDAGGKPGYAADSMRVVGGCSNADTSKFEAEEVLGRECIWTPSFPGDVGSSRSCDWKGIPLHSFSYSTDSDGLVPDSESERIVVSFTEDFDDDVFLIPEGDGVFDGWSNEEVDRYRDVVDGFDE